MLLKRQYNLIALKVTLQTRGENAQVILELEVTEEHQPRTVWQAEIAALAIGLPSGPMLDRADQGVDEFQLPSGLPEAIGEHLRELQYEGPVWLHLVKPYGVLGALPWERLLMGIGNPILRLPDALADRPTENATTLEVVICASRPVSEATFHIPSYLARMVDRIVQASGDDRKVHVNLFADLECMRQIESMLGASGLLNTHVTLWNPHEAAASGETTEDFDARAARLTSPWLMWMLDALRGKLVDVVHLVCHGYLADTGGALAFAQSPAMNNDPRWCRFVGGGELGLFLMRLGAWSVAFSSPENNYSERGLRLLVDELAQTRPGPVLHHDSARDPGFVQLGAAYHFLYARHRRQPDPMSAVALCCQPSLVPDSSRAPELESRVELSVADVDPIVSELPGWVAAAHRYVEQKEFQIQKAHTSNERSSARSRQDIEGISRGVREIRETLQRLARKGQL